MFIRFHTEESSQFLCKLLRPVYLWCRLDYIINACNGFLYSHTVRIFVITVHYVRNVVKRHCKTSFTLTRTFFSCHMVQAMGELRDYLNKYINSRVDTSVPVRTVRCFPNNKPLVTKDIKSLPRKKEAFRSGDQEAGKRVRKKLSKNIREGKRHIGSWSSGCVRMKPGRSGEA